MKTGLGLAFPSTAAKKPGRILVVDDHAAARESMCVILRAIGHEVESNPSAIEALNRLEQ